MAEAAVLRQAGHSVTQYFVSNSDGPAAAAALACSLWNPAAARRLLGVVRRHRPDVAHVHNTWFSLSPAVLSTLSGAGVPVVATLHNFRLGCLNAMFFRDGQPCDDCLGTHLLRGIGHRCYRDSLVASSVAAVSTDFHRRLRTWQRHVELFLVMTQFGYAKALHAGLPGEQVRIKPHFVADPGPRQSPPSTSRTVLYVGRLAPEKGIVALLDAWGVDPPCGLELEVIGDGPLRADLERERPPGVVLTGPATRDEVRQAMSRSRVLVFPSLWYETFGMVLIEAMASGLPILASDIGGTAEVVGDAGWLREPGDPKGWRLALESLADGHEVDTVGARARDRYERLYTPEIGLNALEEVYGYALAHRRSGQGSVLRSGRARG